VRVVRFPFIEKIIEIEDAETNEEGLKKALKHLTDEELFTLATEVATVAETREKLFAKVFECTDEQLTETLAESIDEIRVLLNTNLKRIPKLVMKAKVCQLIFHGHINRFELQEFLLELLKEAKMKVVDKK